MSVGHSARQVFDLPEPRPLVVTEHRAHDCLCAGCGAHSRGSFPDGVNAPVQYGPRIAALKQRRLPQDQSARPDGVWSWSRTSEVERPISAPS
jgi:transposase